ncbi:MAG: ABC transporter permease [Thermoguttaceae bacterium]|jgi:putative ABC transport system permease protein
MNRLSQLLVFSRLARNKKRLVLILFAIAAASCLVVWVIGGYRNLFVEVVHTDNRPFGRYDLMFGAEPSARFGGMRGGQAFGGPLARRPNPAAGDGPGREGEQVRERFDPLRSARAADGSIILDRLPENIPAHMRKRIFKADADRSGSLSRVEEASLYDEPFAREGEESARDQGDRQDSGRGAGTRTVPIPESLLDEMAGDPLVRSLDRMRDVRGFVFGKDPETGVSPIGHDERAGDTGDEMFEETVPEGIDPVLHRRGLAAYRACMGTPMGLGESFTGTDAADPPADLEKGRWFSADRPDAFEAVLAEQAAERFHVEVGDPLLILTKTDEFQLTVVGILDDKRLNGFYVPGRTADLIAGTPAETNRAGITLVSSEKETEFQRRWKGRLAWEVPDVPLTTKADFTRQRLEGVQASSTFRLQAVTGTILAVLASLMIVLTALSIEVEQRRREIGLLRAVGVSRRQVACSILIESFLLAIPGWLGGLLAGWLILRFSSGKDFGLNRMMVGFSFLGTVVGSMPAAMVPILNAIRVRPLEAVSEMKEVSPDRVHPFRRRIRSRGLFLLGVALLASDLILIYGIHTDVPRRAVIHSVFGVSALALGVLCMIPALIRLAERVLLPPLAWMLRFDRTVSANELSAHIGRTTATAAMLAIGGGLFTLMQVWGYSMLGPFLPNKQMPDAFAAFLPIGLSDENAALVREIPHVLQDRFEPVAVEQAAFAPETIPKGRGGEFANVVLFGMDVDRAFVGPRPLVGLKFLQGEPAKAFAAMKSGRGVVVNDALTVDYGFRLGDRLKLCDPKRNSRVLEYPIVGIVSFNGWQWLSKTGGVRRHYGRSGGVVFASDRLVRSDYNLTDTGYFWFDLEKGADDKALEAALDKIARKNLAEKTERENARSEVATGATVGNAAYVKLSTRTSLHDSIAKRADGVIRGLSTMPLVTLALMSIALVAVMVHSVQTRRRAFGILRAVGVERGKLTRMILAEAILLALTAALASLLFGIPAAAGALKLGQSMFGTVDPPLIFPARGLFTGLALLIFLAAAAAVIPAIKIGRAKPLDLLR